MKLRVIVLFALIAGQVGAQGVVKSAKEDSLKLRFKGGAPPAGTVLQVKEGKVTVGMVEVGEGEGNEVSARLVDELAPGVVRRGLDLVVADLGPEGLLVWASRGRRISIGAEVVEIPARLPIPDDVLELRLDQSSGDTIYATLQAGCGEAVALHSLFTLADYDTLRPVTIPLSFQGGGKRVRPATVPLEHPSCVRRRIVLADGTEVWLPGGGVSPPASKGGRRPATIPPGPWSALLQVWITAEAKVRGVHGVSGSADWVREAAETWAYSSKWTPARLEGEPVDCLLTLRFDLEGRHRGR